jgi:hypothetical protein
MHFLHIAIKSNSRKICASSIDAFLAQCREELKSPQGMRAAGKNNQGR